MTSMITLHELGELASTPIGRRNLTVYATRCDHRHYIIQAQLAHYDKVSGERLSVLYQVAPVNRHDSARRFASLSTIEIALRHFGIHTFRYEDHHKAEDSETAA